MRPRSDIAWVRYSVDSRPSYSEYNRLVKLRVLSILSIPTGFGILLGTGYLSVTETHHTYPAHKPQSRHVDTISYTQVTDAQMQ